MPGIGISVGIRPDTDFDPEKIKKVDSASRRVKSALAESNTLSSGFHNLPRNNCLGPPPKIRVSAPFQPAYGQN